MAELSGIPTADDAPQIVQRSSLEFVRPGTIIAGRYEVASRLGAGGMGAVYRVHDRVLDEHVALKVILPAASSDSRALERMRAEVKIARKITHANVCRVFDVGEDGALLFLTMELVEGQTLRQRLAHQHITSDRAFEYFRQIVDGVAAAHEQGVVHRDLKPENILVRSDERCVVADFGLARALEGETKTLGEKAGTPAYMSPEQRRGEALDVRSDVYALGLIGKELLGETSVEIDQIIKKALAEQPENRFAHAGEMGAALKMVSATLVEESLAPTNAQNPADKVDRPREELPSKFVSKKPIASRGIVLVGVAVIVFFVFRFASHRNESPQIVPISTPSSSAVGPGSVGPSRVAIVVRAFDNLTGDTKWNGLSQSAPESMRAVLRTIPDVSIVEREDAVFSVRGNVQKMGDRLRLFAQMEPVVAVGDVLPGEPMEVDVTGELAPALDALRSKLLDEARIALGRYRRWQRATMGTENAVAREKLHAYYRLIGPAPRSEHFAPGLRLLEESIAADFDYAPARVERVYLWLLGAIEGTGYQRYERALVELNDLLQKHPGDAEALVMRCRVAQGLVERVDNPRDAPIDRAMSACRDALTAAPLSAHVHITLGRLHNRRCEDEQAMRALSRAVELDRSLSGRALSQLLYIAQAGGRVLIADRASTELLAFQEEEDKLGVRALSRRSGAPETRGAHLARGSVLLTLGRFPEASEAFSRELTRITENHGNAVDEATAIRGLLRAAKEEKKTVPPALVARLEVLEKSYRDPLRAKPEDVQILARTYQFVDPSAAADFIAPLGPPHNCEDAIQRALIYRFSGRTARVEAMLAACSPTEAWERQCITGLFPDVNKK